MVEEGAGAEGARRARREGGEGRAHAANGWRRYVEENEAREEARRLEVFDAGGKLAKKKRGLRKADLAEHAESRDRGLAWGSGNFRGGVLTVSKKDLSREENAGTGAAYLAGTKLSGADGKRARGKGKSGAGSKTKGGRPQGGKKYKKKR